MWYVKFSQTTFGDDGMISNNPIPLPDINPKGNPEPPTWWEPDEEYED